MAAWAENAYVSGWGFKQGAIGNRDDVDRIRYADNAGLMLGSLNYDPTEKVFSSDYNTLVFTNKFKKIFKHSLLSPHHILSID